MLKHVEVSTWEVSPTEKNIHGYPMPGGNTIRRLVAVKVDCDRVVVKSLAGPDLPAGLLFPILSATLPDGWLAEAEKLHQFRKNPWLVRTRYGMSGCRDYFLYSLRDEEYLPRMASLHVSMAGKLNEGLRLWLGDLPPLLAAVLEDYPPATEGVSFRVYEPVLRGGYQEPGADSGLQTVLDSLKAMEVMSK